MEVSSASKNEKSSSVNVLTGMGRMLKSGLSQTSVDLNKFSSKIGCFFISDQVILSSGFCYKHDLMKSTVALGKFTLSYSTIVSWSTVFM